MGKHSITILILILMLLTVRSGFADSKVQHDRIPRLSIALTDDGKVWIHGEEISVDQFRAFAVAVASINPKTRLYIQAEKNVTTPDIKKTVKAWGEAGLRDVIFGSLVQDPRSQKR